MKFMTLQVPDNNYDFFVELMKKLNVATVSEENILISEAQKDLVRDRIKNLKKEDLQDIDTALSQIKFDEKV
jgi:hypothetical protein